MEDQTAPQAPVEATAEVSEPIANLYLKFVEAAVTSAATNTTVAQGSILMLADALANMSGAYKLGQTHFNEIVGQIIENLEQAAMNLSHVAAAAVAEVMAPIEADAVSADDADMEVKN